MRARRIVGGALATVTVHLVLLAGCGDPPTRADSSFFTIRPIAGQSAPPCTAPALAEVRGGDAVRCYEVGAAEVDAGDVTSASVATDRATQTEDVQFVLSAEGTERLNGLARTVGVGGRAAIVVDGMVVGAIRFETTDFQGRGVVSGLGAAEAERLARRLNRG